MHPMIQLALRAARSVIEHYDHVIERLDIARQDRNVDELIDHCAFRVEQALQRQLKRGYPDFSFNGTHIREEAQGDSTWVVNPLVGRDNLARGYPACALSVALYAAGRLEHVVIINPLSGQEFIAGRGRGASLNGRRIRVLTSWHAEQAHVAMPLPEMGVRMRMLPTYLDVQQYLGQQVAHLNTMNEPVLDLLAVAAGQLDAAIILGADMDALAPALMVLKEAGGLYGDVSGAPNLGSDARLLAANPKTFKALVSGIRPVL
ncbi:hypothetical protein BFW38_01015 [Terasakiispira papahanaumokuakeensis]|uniref:Inositol monophosphatase n=1 Tax=Terasakiispira papahanaumokuakeensis TaxID=197479 RepID=A0A1E2VDP1_9GAMM|nr:inositol monophosphatase family protein [Terasakiispira papahanaumokuakeensis]ODC05097.1 hypothetical protein BFW38_01015 [Terasakiispira papahanaumokuakeensis]